MVWVFIEVIASTLQDQLQFASVKERLWSFDSDWILCAKGHFKVPYLLTAVVDKSLEHRYFVEKGLKTLVKIIPARLKLLELIEGRY